MLFLKQSTAVTVKIGPAVSLADATRLTGLSLTQADIRLSKNGEDFAQKNSATACTHDEYGWYNCPLSATDTNTLGRLQLDAIDASALPMPHDFMVVTANQYDSLCGTDYFDVNLVGNQSVTIATVTNLTNKTGFSLASDQTGVTFGTVNNVADKTGYRLSSAGVDDFFDEALAGHTTAGTAGLTLANILRIGKNKWAYSGTTFTIYADNGTDALYQFTLDSAESPTSRTPV